MLFLTTLRPIHTHLFPSQSPHSLSPGHCCSLPSCVSNHYVPFDLRLEGVFSVIDIQNFRGRCLNDLGRGRQGSTTPLSDVEVWCCDFCLISLRNSAAAEYDYTKYPID